MLPGALFASIGWQGTGLGFSFYVNNFTNYSATYGSVGDHRPYDLVLHIRVAHYYRGEINALKHVKMQEHVHTVSLDRGIGIDRVAIKVSIRVSRGVIRVRTGRIYRIGPFVEKELE